MANQARTHQHAANPNIQLAHTLHGSPALEGVALMQSVGPNVQQATQFSTAPYISPEKTRKDGNRTAPQCEVETCAAYAMKGKPYCRAHGRQFDLLTTEPQEPTDEPG